MNQWVRNGVMVLVVLVWAVVVLTNLFRGLLPDAITWGVPGAMWLAINPVIPRRRQTPPQQEREQSP